MLSIKCDWNNAVKYADILREQCAWSPAIYTYQSAVFLAMIQDEEEQELTRARAEGRLTIEQANEKQLTLHKRRERINELMRQVPALRIRYAGKTIPAEKFAVTHAEKYFTAGQHLLLPAFEYIYIWNIFVIIEKDTSLVAPILKRIETKLQYYDYEHGDCPNIFTFRVVAIKLKLTVSLLLLHRQRGRIDRQSMFAVLIARRLSSSFGSTRRIESQLRTSSSSVSSNL